MKIKFKKIINIIILLLISNYFLTIVNAESKTYTITLDNQNASITGTTKIYEKYGEGFYKNSNTTTKLNKIVVPSKSNYTFGGYYKLANGIETQYIDSKGNLKANSKSFTSNTTLYAKWIEWVIDYKDKTNYHLKAEKSNFEKAFQETAYAFYMRGTNIQYNARKVKQLYSPENATYQESKYITCAPFFTNIYTEILGSQLSLSLPASKWVDYAINNSGRTEVIAYGKKFNYGWKMAFKSKVTNLESDDKCKVYIDTSSSKTISYINYDCFKKNYSVDYSDNKTTGQELLLSQLKIGDILAYSKADDGHTFMVYDLIYDKNNNVVDAIIIESTHGTAGSFYYPNSKVLLNENTIGNSYYNSYYNKTTGVVEGSIRFQLLSNYVYGLGKFGSTEKEEYCILRLITGDGTSNMKLNYYDKKNNKKYNNYSISLTNQSSQTRINYSKIYIEKTVDKYDNNTVDLEDILEYTIVIKNNSSNNYMYNLKVTEKIDTSLVEFIGNTSKNSYVKYNDDYDNKKGILSWTIGKLKANESAIIKYKVKVNNDDSNLGKMITSTGKVGNISISTVRNRIGSNLNSSEEENIKKGYEDAIKSGKTGIELIEETYKNAGIITNLNLENVLKSNINSKDGNNLIHDSYDICKITTGKDTISTCFNSNTLTLNKNNPMYSAILNNYWNKTYRVEPTQSLINNKKYPSNKYVYDMKLFNNRRDTIYKEHFKTGDILLYTNQDDYRYECNSNNECKFIRNTYENGLYAFIYIDGKFQGINKGNDKNSKRNIFNKSYYVYNKLTLVGSRNNTVISPLDFNGNKLDTNFFNYDTLYSKDSFVILRPSLMLKRNPVTITGKSNLVFNNTNQELVTISNNTSKSNVCLSLTKISSCSKTNTSLTKKNPGTYKVYYYISGGDTYFPKKGYVNVTISKNDNILKETLTKKGYKIKNNYVSGFKLNDTLTNVKSKLGLNYTTDNKIDKVATGITFKYNNETFVSVVRGDLNGDGNINSADLLKMKQYLLDESKLNGAYKEAGLINNDNVINSADLLMIRQHLLNTKAIEQ